MELIFTGASSLPRLRIASVDVPVAHLPQVLEWAESNVKNLAPVLSPNYWWAGLFDDKGQLIREWSFKLVPELK